MRLNPNPKPTDFSTRIARIDKCEQLVVQKDKALDSMSSRHYANGLIAETEDFCPILEGRLDEEKDFLKEQIKRFSAQIKNLTECRRSTRLRFFG